MSYTAVTLPLTGAGDATAAPAVDVVDGKAYQAMKLMDGTEGSTVPIPALGTTPGSTAHGLIVRPIGSTAHNQAVVGAVGLTSGSSEVALTSAGSTRLVGRVTLENPTTVVTVSSGVVLGAGSTANALGAVALLAGTSANTIGNVTVSNLSTGGGSTTVDANLSSAGSTKVVGTVNVSSGVVLGGSTQMTGLISSGTQTIGTVVLTSGGILGASTAAIGQLTSGTQTIGSVQLSSAGTTGSIGSVALLAGSTANVVGAVANSSGTQTIGSVQLTSAGTTGSIGSVALLAGSSASVIGQAAISSANPIYLGLGTSATYNFMQSIPFSSGNAARTTINSSIDVSVIAANANRKALIIASVSTAQVVALGLTTAAVTTGLVGVSLYLEPMKQVSFGLQGGLPLFLGPVRGINITSTAVGGGLAVTEFT